MGHFELGQFDLVQAFYCRCFRERFFVTGIFDNFKRLFELGQKSLVDKLSLAINDYCPNSYRFFFSISVIKS